MTDFIGKYLSYFPPKRINICGYCGKSGINCGSNFNEKSHSCHKSSAI